MERKTRYIIIALCCVFGIILGSTTAWYTWTSDENTDVTFTIGGLTIIYEAGPDISNKKLRPTSNKENAEYAIQKEITISSNKQTYLSLYLEANEFPLALQHESLKWELYDDINLISSGNFKYINQGEEIALLNNYGIKEGKKLNLYIWIDGNMENPSEMSDQNYKFMLRAEATDNEIDHGLYYYDVSDTTPGLLAGSGTETDPYLIESIEDLITFSNEVNFNNKTYEGEYIHLKQSLNFNYDKSYVDSTNTKLFKDYNGDGTLTGIKEEVTIGQGFIPIGMLLYEQDGDEDISGVFSGTFLGNDNSIMNININYNEDSTYDTSYVGLFGYARNATINNLSLSGNVKGYLIDDHLRMAGIVGIVAYGNISNLVNYARIEGNAVHQLDTTLASSSDLIVGGIGGFIGPNSSPGNEVVIENNYNYGTIIINSENFIENSIDHIAMGGIIGYNSNGNIEKNINYGNIIINSTSEVNKIDVGGIVGTTISRVSQCVNSQTGTISGNVVGAIVRVGGISGYATRSRTDLTRSSNILYSHNMADINFVSNSDEAYFGGISGALKNSSTSIANSYNTGNISVNSLMMDNVKIGGIEGYILEEAINQNSYYINTIGALYGLTDGSAIKVENSTFKTSNEMKSSAFVDLLNTGLSEPMWVMDTDGINAGYPILSFENDN